MKKWLFPLALLGASSAFAGAKIDLDAEASRTAANNFVRASVFAESSAPSPGEAAKKVNALLAKALEQVKDYPPVKAQSTGVHSYPVYAKNGQAIESWRVRAEIAIESGDVGAVASLLGSLQGKFGVSGLNFRPSPDAAAKAENAATLDAIAAFRARAELIASAFGKTFHIRKLEVRSPGLARPTLMRAAAPMVGAAALPLEAGETSLTVNVSGQIELDD